MLPILQNKRLQLAAFLSILISSSATPAAQDNKEKLDKVRDQMQHLQTGLNKKEQRRSAVQQELKSTEKMIGQQNRELKKLNKEIATQKQRIRVAKIQQGLNRNSMESQRKDMEQQIRMAYIMGRQDRMKLLLNQQDPEQVGRLMVYHDYFNRSRMEQLDLIQATLKKLQQSEQEMLAEERKMQLLQSKKQREMSTLERNRKGRKVLIAGLNREIVSDGERLQELKRDEQRLQQLLVQIQQQVKAKKQGKYLPKGRPFQTQKGKLSWPAKGKLTAHYGSAKSGDLKWDGVFIVAPEGGEVRAVYGGKVVFADWLRGFGLLIILDHGDGYMTLYGHNQSLAREEGDLVRAEEVVATLGNSGGQTESGVYFAMRYKGDPVNPEKWLR